MACCDMCDLMTEHGSELRLRVHIRQHAAGHEDEAAGKGECVWGGIVNHLEAPGKLRPLAAGRKLRAELLHILLQRVVLHEVDRGPRLLRGLTADLNLLLLGYESELPLAR